MNPNHYCLKKTLVVKGSSRSRKKKGLKSIPQQAKDFADIRGSDEEVSLGSKGMLKAKSTRAISRPSMPCPMPPKTLSQRVAKSIILSRAPLPEAELCSRPGKKPLKEFVNRSLPQSTLPSSSLPSNAQ